MRILNDKEIHKITDHWNPIPSRIDGIAPEVIKQRLFQFVARAQAELTLQELMEYECKECSTPNIIHLVIPRKELK